MWRERQPVVSQSTAALLVSVMDNYAPTFFLCVCILGSIACSLGEDVKCDVNEHVSPGDKCQMTCNGCRDCGPCLCNRSYIRSYLGEPCITETECHKLHKEWLHEAKYDNKKDKFFNCKLEELDENS